MELLKNMSNDGWLILIIMALFFVATLLLKLFAKNMQRMLKEILRNQDIQEIDNQASDQALSIIFARNKMTNGITYSEEKRAIKIALLKEYRAKKEDTDE
jgi:hypothetical protein